MAYVVALDEGQGKLKAVWTTDRRPIAKAVATALRKLGRRVRILSCRRFQELASQE